MYRAISLLSYLDKILEKAVHQRLYRYLNRINFLCSNQFGFRENHSTEAALMSTINRIYKLLDESKYTILISIDFRKAFDVIRHDILIDKLEHIDIRGFMLEWFKSYLNDRKQQTQANSVISDSLTVKTGVPQGSSLGPLPLVKKIAEKLQFIHDNTQKLQLLHHEIRKLQFIHAYELQFLYINLL